MNDRIQNLLISLILVSKLFFISVCGLANSEITGGFSDPGVDKSVAHFTLVKDRKRTTRIIRKGRFSTKIVSPKLGQALAAIPVEMNYFLNLGLFGKKQGRSIMEVDEFFFTKEFLTKLRKDRRISFEDFRVSFVGLEDIKLKDGRKFESSDRILIDEIKNLPPSLEFIVDLLETLNSAQKDKDPLEIQDLKLHANLVPCAPVLGAARIDLSGREGSLKAIAGFDLKSPISCH